MDALYVESPDAPMARVLKEVCRGARTVKEIAWASGVQPNWVRVYLHRLMDRGLVYRVRSGKEAEWHLKEARCLLSEVWR